MPGTGVWVAAAMALLLLVALPATTAQPPPTIHVWPTVEPETKEEPYYLGPERQARFNTTFHMKIESLGFCSTETTIGVGLRIPAFPHWAGTSIGEPATADFTVGPGPMFTGERTESGPPIDIAWDPGPKASNKAFVYEFQAVIEEISGPAGTPESCSPRLSMMERDEGVALVNVTTHRPAGADAERLDGSTATPGAPTVAVLTALCLGAFARRSRR